jgi:1-acyl-sn-glycerol-3-phosphate acyltransferase
MRGIHSERLVAEATRLKLRGYLTLGSVGLLFLLGDPFQRIVITTAVKVLPSRRDRILGRWQRFLAHSILGMVRHIGGASIGDLPRLPSQPGVLVVMNHQSVLDIPLVVAAHDDLYPVIVTRARYSRGKPVISHMVRLYQYPVVDPRATVRGHLSTLAEVAREATTPVVIYPEGTRSRDGQIGAWKRRGLKVILESRQWSVYLVVADGLWQVARLDDFVRSVSSVRARIVRLGPFTSPAPGESMEDFMDEMKERMQEALEELRAASPE